ncbi:Capsular polysaccharide biosynthesis protein [Alkalibacterium subtropicum]|uniref:Capsular polysaccharide biosynthesis protein CpsC n=1 Tax=Alkalibacterium subtropicum TaxID=753702 RepID=A0A1I1GHC4_9LACT|nr:Wzz/FepE/Etk N-terminal domain-containing protein [Alkalibacterium subtropicum]SFC10931.1 Capsular polysaccharide biosynthesis protein [Alkalibacterium subtropicum]
MEEEISLVELFAIIKKRLALIINLTLLGLLITAVYTFFIATPEYSATTQLLVNRTQQTEMIQQSDINTNLQLINTYKDIIKGPVILDDVREDLNLSLTHTEVADKISISNASDSQVFSITVNDTDPYAAAELANTTASVFQEKLNEIMNVDNITVISPAVPDTSPVSPNNTLNLAIGLVLGGMVGVGLAFLLEFLDNTVKDEDFIVEELGWTSLGIVSKMNPDDLKADEHQPLTFQPAESRRTRSRV